MRNLIEPPDGILREILSLLPLKSLFRLKCVSKSWYALITSLHTPQNVVLKRMVTNKKTGNVETRFSFFNYDDDKSIVDFPCLGPEFERSQIHGHCGGTLCLSIRPGVNIFLYNLPTGELRKLPPSVLLSPPDEPYDQFDGGLKSVTSSVGFGYDLKSRGFKVVRIVKYCEKIWGVLETWSAEVYDWAKDGWREIKTRIPGCTYRMPCFDMYYQGLYYWWAVVDMDESNTEIIMWFDVGEEIFGQIALPEAFSLGVYPMDLKRRSLGFLNGSMVVLHYPCLRPRHNHNWLDVWGLVKDKVMWSKLFTIGPLFGIDIPLAFVSSDELLMEDKEGELVLYNFNTQHSQHIPINGHRTPFDDFSLRWA